MIPEGFARYFLLVNFEAKNEKSEAWLSYCVKYVGENKISKNTRLRSKSTCSTEEMKHAIIK